MRVDLRRLAFRLGWAVHRAVFRLSRGRLGTRAASGRGVGVLFLTTKGRRSGQPRTTALYYAPHGSAFVVVPSNAGSEEEPAWWRNLQVAPEARVRIGDWEIVVRGRAGTQEESERLWPDLARRYRGWPEYRERLRRDLPIVILEPIEPG